MREQALLVLALDRTLLVVLRGAPDLRARKTDVNGTLRPHHVLDPLGRDEHVLARQPVASVDDEPPDRPRPVVEHKVVDFARNIIGDFVELAEYVDAPRQVYRVAAFREGRLVGCLFVGPADTAPHWDAVKASFAAETLDPGWIDLTCQGQHLDGKFDIDVGLGHEVDDAAGATAEFVQDAIVADGEVIPVAEEELLAAVARFAGK